jgi:hypothetical protein
MISQRIPVRRFVCLLVAMGCAAGCLAQKASSCQIEYENQNQVDYVAPSRVGVVGVVTNKTSTPVATACVAVFTEDGHRFVLGRKSGATGKFQLPLLREGAYRLVIKAEGFGVANVKFRIVPETFADSVLHAHMLARAIDVTSYIDSK